MTEVNTPGKDPAKDRIINGKLGLQQRVLPAYRILFFDQLASSCEAGLSIFAGQPTRGESIQTSEQLKVANYSRAHNLNFFSVHSAFYFLWQRGLLRWLNSWNPDVLILEANARYFSNRRAVRWMHARGRPVIGWGLGALPVRDQAFSGLHRRLRSSFLHSCDALISYSRKGAEEFIAEGMPREKVFIALNSVEPAPTSPLSLRPDNLQNPPVVLFVGRLQARKRIDNLLHACAGLPESFQPHLVIVGDGPVRGELIHLAGEVYPNVEFPGEKSGLELEPYFRRADLFVLPGTGGLAVQQAMAYALPVLVAEADGTQEDLVRQENGWIIPPGDVQALRRALESALSDPARLRRMGLHSYEIAVKEVNIEAMVDVFLRAIDTVISPCRG